MERRVEELLEEKGGSYVLPFFWQHGENEEKLREYMGVIYDSNIREVCVECRPHPDFCGPKWWQDMDVIMEEARNRGMRVWLLDDAHFPTGYANGGYEEADPSLCKQYLNFVTADVDGPTPQMMFDLQKEMDRLKLPVPGPGPQISKEEAEKLGMHFPKERIFDDDQLKWVIAYKVEENGKLGEAVDITEYVENGVLTWDVPDGMWRIYGGYLTHNGGGESDYMNVISAPSIRVLIDQVYEPHFARYGADFGKTFAGFFSDEPLTGNCKANYDPHSLIGTVRMYLPWDENVEEMLEETLGADYRLQTPVLWNDSEEADVNAKVRFAYMDAVTRLIRKNFSLQIGDWCRAHGVEYIGHLVEDMNCSANLGLSLGNFYRAEAGMDMAGIDVIGGGVMLAGENRVPDGEYYGDGNFFHYYLGKLGSSLAHVDPAKKGRTMCELYGAYGWDFGVRSMKYLTDHMLLRGINHFTPHAFTPKAFPDPDCPPHFYANGENPQYPYFGRLMKYLQRVAHLIDGGRSIPQVGLLHCDEALWTDPSSMRPQLAARKLMENQIDFDILFQDLFVEKKYTLSDALYINGNAYHALVIPRYSYVRRAVADFAKEAKEKNFPVFFIDAKPVGLMDSEEEITEELNGEILSLEALGRTLRDRGIFDIALSKANKKISYYHYKHEKDIYLLSNESTGITYEGEVFLPIEEDAFRYDAEKNLVRPLSYTKEPGGIRVSVTLKPFEPWIIVFGEKVSTCTEVDRIEEIQKTGAIRELKGFEVSICENKEYPAFHDTMEMETLKNLAVKYPDFSGIIRYETVFERASEELPREEKSGENVAAGGKSASLEGREGKEQEAFSEKKNGEAVRSQAKTGCVLHLENAYECVSVWCNDILVGSVYHPEYSFDLSNALKEGENRLRIEVATTLDRKVRTILGEGGFRRCPPAMDPIGIIGKVELYSK